MFSLLSDSEALITEKILVLAVYPMNTLTAGVAIIATSGMTLWAIYRAYLIMAGLVAEPFGSTMKDLISRCVILLVAGSSAFFLTSIMTPMITSQESLARELASNAGFSSGNIFVTLETKMAQILYLLQELFSNTGEQNLSIVDSLTQADGTLSFIDYAGANVAQFFYNIGQTTDGISNFEAVIQFIGEVIKLLSVLVSLIFIALAAFITVIINKIFFVICLGFAPLFIMFLAFPATKGWFSSWLNTTMGYMLSYPVVVAVVGTLLSIFDQLFARESFTMLDAMICTICSIIFGVIITRLGDIASAWFGGGNISDGTALASAGALRSAGRKVSNSAKGAYKTGRAIGGIGRSFVSGKPSIKKQ